MRDLTFAEQAREMQERTALLIEKMQAVQHAITDLNRAAGRQSVTEADVTAEIEAMRRNGRFRQGPPPVPPRGVGR